MKTATKKIRLFISFDFIRDRVFKDFITGQVKHSDSPFEIVDTSAKDVPPEDEWIRHTESKIRNCDQVLIMVGPRTYRAPGVLKEVALAKKWNKPITQIVIYRANYYCRPVFGVGPLHQWDWENLKELLD